VPNAVIWDFLMPSIDSPDTPECRYETFEDLFGPIPSWDRGFSASVAEAVDRLAIELQPQQVIGPLGVGRNVDHLHLRNVVMRMSNSRSVGECYESQLHELFGSGRGSK
jgi:hypothetical protein